MTLPRRRRRSLVRGLSGVLVGGLVALALVLLAGWFYADRTGLPGPGARMLVGHLTAAAVAVMAQVSASRRTDRVRNAGRRSAQWCPRRRPDAGLVVLTSWARRRPALTKVPTRGSKRADSPAQGDGRRATTSVPRCSSNISPSTAGTTAPWVSARATGRVRSVRPVAAATTASPAGTGTSSPFA